MSSFGSHTTDDSYYDDYYEEVPIDISEPVLCNNSLPSVASLATMTNISQLSSISNQTTTTTITNRDSVSHHQHNLESMGTDPLRESFLQTQLQLQSQMYTESKNLKVAIGSWNVNSKLINSDTILDDFLQLKHNPDIIVIGLQEIDMTAQAMIKSETDQCELWANSLDGEIANAKHKYDRWLAKQMVGLCLCVYVKHELRERVKHFKSDILGLGAMGRMGNKGGVGARFQLYDTSFCFITSHLAPHMDGTLKRNQHFQDILTKLDFGGMYTPDSHDYLFWFGDLNYRIEHEIHEVKRLVKEKDYKTLLEHDQLTIEKFAGRVFWGFKEAPIHFPPTYKYDPGTLVFDTSEKERTPSYTDRILYKGKKRDKVKQMKYERYELLISDHLPVASLFHCEVQMVVDYKFRACRDRLLKEFDSSTNHTTTTTTTTTTNTSLTSAKLLDDGLHEEDDDYPELELNSILFDYNQIRYDTPAVQTLKLKNVGRVMAEFLFVPKPSEDYPSQPWLRISPMHGLITPGETCEIKLTVFIDHTTGAHELNDPTNSTNGEINDTLIIHVENGRDYFVQVQGEFQKSCFGNSLSNLVQCNDPLRIMQQKQAVNKLRSFTATAVNNNRQNEEAEDEEVKGVKLYIPKELWRMTDYIFKYGTREAGLFQETGDMNEVSQIRELLDNGDSLEEYNGSIHSMTDALISFLESLEDPIIPHQYYKKCMENYLATRKLRSEVINRMPPLHYNVFQYLLAFLKEVLLNSDVNGLKPDQLAQGFANLLLRSPLHMPEEQKELDRRSKIIILKNFLKEDDSSKLPDHKLFKNY